MLRPFEDDPPVSEQAWNETLAHIRQIRPSVQPHPQHEMRRFVVKFDNSRRRSLKTPLQTYTAEGVQFSPPGRHVMLDTEATNKAWRNLDDMINTLKKWGRCEVSFLDEEAS